MFHVFFVVTPRFSPASRRGFSPPLDSLEIQISCPVFAGFGAGGFVPGGTGGFQSGPSPGLASGRAGAGIPGLGGGGGELGVSVGEGTWSLAIPAPRAAGRGRGDGPRSGHSHGGARPLALDRRRGIDRLVNVTKPTGPDLHVADRLPHVAVVRRSPNIVRHPRPRLKHRHRAAEWPLRSVDALGAGAPPGTGIGPEPP